MEKLTLCNKEVFKDIPSYPYYKISESGVVFSLRRNKFISKRVNYKGYEDCCLFVDGKIKTTKVHRLVALSFIVNTENKPQVNHIDGNKLNNHYLNLEWCTPKENISHAFNTGLKKPHPIGSKRSPDGCKNISISALKRGKSNNRKLAKEDVFLILENFDKLSIPKLAKKFNISVSAIKNIKYGIHYKECFNQFKTR